MNSKRVFSVEIVIPVYNEEACLHKNVLILFHYLKKIADFPWKITIADNASTDQTPQIAKELTQKYENISYLHVPVKGRGHALRNAFLQSSSDVVCYTDVDLSTNLRYIKILLDGIACGFDISIGSRLMQGSRTKRRIVREVFSRMYNFLIKLLFFNRFSDAQCGFKALRTDVARKLIPLIKNNNWFFDTELLLQAEYNDYRIFEVPVEWTEDIKTKVKLGKTILEDLAGLMRMRFTIRRKQKNKITFYKVAVITVFMLAALLRFSLGMVNRQANDNHFNIVRIIIDEGRIPTGFEGGEEFFQPKLYHATAAMICKLFHAKQEEARIIISQQVNCAAGMFTLLILFIFLQGTALSRKARFITFSLAALNPGLIAINAQGANDSFAILFVTAAIYCTYRFLQQGSMRYFLGVFLFSILAGVSKGTGLALFPALILVFILKIIAERKNASVAKRLLLLTLFFSCIYLPVVFFYGQYYYNRRHYNSAFAINILPDPFPNLFKHTRVTGRDWLPRPGVTSIASAYGTFRIVELIKYPTIPNFSEVFPRHRTSLWSQLYARTNFIFYDQWPPMWELQDPTVFNIGRIILVLALLPLGIFLAEFIRCLAQWARRIFRRDLSDLRISSEWALDIFLFEYIAFIIAFTLCYRDFGSMKAIFIFPAVIPVAWLFSRGLERILNRYARTSVAVGALLLSLIICYIVTIAVLFFHLKTA